MGQRFVVCMQRVNVIAIRCKGSRTTHQGNLEPDALAGMTEGENYRDLLTRLSTALAMTEEAYLEARRRRDL
jgi:hypothetical protein